MPLSVSLLYIAMFTISWDRLANVTVGTFNVKVPTLMFAAALALALVDVKAPKLAGRGPSWLAPMTILLVITYAAASMWALNERSAHLQTVTVVLGAVVPFSAVYVIVRQWNCLDGALTALIRGGYVAAVFGLYQLAAFTVGAPQLIDYRATSGGLGRIAAFNYEAGYFGYFMVIVIGAVFARASLRGTTASWKAIAFFVFVILAANSRATLLILPLLLVLLYFRWPERDRRLKLWPFATVGGMLALLVGLTFPTLVASLVERASSLFDPSEATSNAPRLETLRGVMPIVEDNFWGGIGPGNLIEYSYTYSLGVGVDASSNSVVVNNVWVQALLDAGPVLLALQIMWVVMIATSFYRRSLPAARMLTASWLAAFAIASLITSYFWDMKFWVVTGLLAAMSAMTREPKPEESSTPKDDGTQDLTGTMSTP